MPCPQFLIISWNTFYNFKQYFLQVKSARLVQPYLVYVYSILQGFLYFYFNGSRYAHGRTNT